MQWTETCTIDARALWDVPDSTIDRDGQMGVRMVGCSVATYTDGEVGWKVGPPLIGQYVGSSRNNGNKHGAYDSEADGLLSTPLLLDFF